MLTIGLVTELTERGVFLEHVGGPLVAQIHDGKPAADRALATDATAQVSVLVPLDIAARVAGVLGAGLLLRLLGRGPCPARRGLDPVRSARAGDQEPGNQGDPETTA